MGALRVFDVDPRDAEDLTTRHAPGEAGDLHHLQAASLGELALRSRNEPVEPRTPTVFGLVDDPRLRIDGDRFVSEPAHVPEGHGGGGLLCGNLEHPPVLLRELKSLLAVLGARPVHRLLAREPRPPRSRTARAIAGRAG